MILLVSGATKTSREMKGNKNFGVLKTPQDWNQLKSDYVWAADNSAYSNWDEGKFIKMIEKIRKHSHKPVFIAAPDVVGNAIRTADLFDHWQPIIKNLLLPVALVLQNGQESIGIPWGKLDAIFIGGDNNFKLGRYVRYIISKAKENGKWVHMGRVNSLKRIQYAFNVGCDSIDGSSCSRFPDTYIKKFVCFIEKLEKQQNMFKIGD